MTWDDLTAEERAVAYSANADRLMTPAELNRYWRVYVDAPDRLSNEDAHARAVADFLATRRRDAGQLGEWDGDELEGGRD